MKDLGHVRTLSINIERGLRQQRILAIALDYVNGMIIDDIVETYEVSRGTVYRIINAMQLSKRGQRKIDFQVRTKVLESIKQELPYAEIARIHNVSEAWVCNVARAAGIKRYKTPRTKKHYRGRVPMSSRKAHWSTWQKEPCEYMDTGVCPSLDRRECSCHLINALSASVITHIVSRSDEDER